MSCLRLLVHSPNDCVARAEPGWTGRLELHLDLAQECQGPRPLGHPLQRAWSVSGALDRKWSSTDVNCETQVVP